MSVSSHTKRDGLLTIVLTSYNYGKYIQKAVQSVVEQTCPNWRLLIFDNHSTDNTLDVLNPFLTDPRITLVIRDKNIGARDNLNQGLRSVDTEFVAGLQADDFIDNKFVETVISHFHLYRNIPFVFFDWQQYMDDSKQFINHNRHPFPKSRSGLTRIGPFLSICNFVPFHVVAFRTECLMKYFDYYIDSPIHQVGEQFILKMLEDHFGCGSYSGSIGGYWRRHDNQLTAAHMASSQAQIEEPLERHWYITKAPEPDYVNVLLCLIIFIHYFSHEKYLTVVDWLINNENGIRYASSFGVPVKSEQERLQLIILVVALKYSTYSTIILVDQTNLKEWLCKLNCQPNCQGLYNALRTVSNMEGESFLNSEEIKDICSKFFGESFESYMLTYSTWFSLHSQDSKRSQTLLLKQIKQPKLFPIIHFFMIVDFTDQYDNSQNEIDCILNNQSVEHYQTACFSMLNKINILIKDLLCQALDNWQLTVFSEMVCPDNRFTTNQRMKWVQLSCKSAQSEAVSQIVINSQSEWFICVSAGLRFSSLFTFLIGHRLLQCPDALLVYADEDLVINDGYSSEDHLNPKLKPEINLDLLRSVPYVGAATIIRKKLMLDPRIEILPPGLSRNYGAALLAVEQGLSAVCHLDEILVHVPESVADQYAVTPLAHLLVQQHLARCGTAAEVRDGPLPGTLFIDYQLPDQPPKISVIVAPAQSRLSDTRACLESLLTNTNYPDFEVIVIDHSIDPGLPALLVEASSRFPHIQILRCPHKQSLLTSYNAAAHQAQGAFLLFLKDDCVVLQENWIMRLAAIGTRAEVGVVGCRLVSLDQKIRHAGLILGHGGTVGHIGKDLPLVEPGYMGRAQLTQNFSAVSGDCMLVRKELFLDVGGFDEKDFPNLYHDADFCLKVGERGYQIVWTPFVTLAQQNKDDLEEKQKAQKEQQDSLSRKVFIKKWRSRLGNDPAYNRHLSLRQRTWMIDGDFDVPWHPDLEPLPRIVAQPPDEMGVGQYRMIGPLKELTDSGRICSFLLPALTSDKRFLPYVSELIRAKPTVFFLQNAFSDFHLDDLQQYADLLPDLFRVFGQDDIVFSVPQKSSARKHFGKDTKARVRRAVSLCHRVIVTTEPIAEALRGMNDDIRIMPNYLERSRWGDLQAPRNERRKPRVGWAGAQQHQGDLEFILPVIEATANEVDWIFMGMCPPKLRYHVAETHPAVAFDEYPTALAKLDLDLAIAPLELNRFNAAKSNLRLLEYGAVGYPVIATDILPYQGAPVTRVPNNPQAWIKAIREHIHELEATRAAGERLRQWVLSDWMLDQHLDEWLRALLPD